VSTRRICAVTGSRADFGLLAPVLRLVRDAPDLSLSLVATGMHLADAFGGTVDEIEAAGFVVDARVPVLEAGDGAEAVTRAIGRGVIGFAELLPRLAPDMLLVLGDRYEILAAVQAALIARVPVAHIAGGDVTEGAFDDAIRHAITKMAHLHFATNAESARRIRQMGEDPARVHVTGSPGIDALLAVEPLPRADFFEAVGLEPRPHNIVLTYHPVTLDPAGSLPGLDALLSALDGLGDAVGMIVTGPNADTDGRLLGGRLAAFATARPNAVFHRSLGHRRYLSALRHVDAVVGNSSSGLYEAPSFGLPTVNIGDRQTGRLKAASVVDCPPEADAIAAAVRRALDTGRSAPENPYGDGHAAPRIVAALKGVVDPRALLRKHFFDLRLP